MQYAPSKAMNFMVTIGTLVLVTLSAFANPSYAAAPPIANILPRGCDA
jgi:hypothetical protein